MGRPAVVVGLSGPSGVAIIPALSVETNSRRLDHAERDLNDMLDRAGIVARTVAEADIGPAGVPDAAFYVSVNVTSYSENFEGPDGRYWAGFIFGCITAGLGFLIAIDSHSNSSHTFEFEVRVYDVRGAPVVRSTDSTGTIVNRYDTSISAPLLRRNYSGTMHSWIGAGTGGPTGADLEAFINAESEEIASVIFDAAAEDIAHAISTAPPPAAAPQEIIPAAPLAPAAPPAP